MGITITLGIILLVYIKSFKDDFKEEDIKKVQPFIIGAALIFILFGILTSII